MATTTAEAPQIEGFTFDEYEPEEQTAGKYDAHVAALLARDEQLEKADPDAWASGKRTRGHIVVPTGEPKVTEGEDGEPDETTYPAVAKEKRLFQESARYRDRTARLVGENPQGDGYTKLSFILIPKQSRPRKSADAAEVQEVDEDE